MSANNQKTRNSSIEMLRIIAMLGVVILHYNNENLGGALKYVGNNVNRYYIYFSENLFICAVDLFIMISAFYLSNTNKRKIIKTVELVMQVIVFNVVAYLVSVVIFGGDFSIRTLLGRFIPSNYFVILYSVLYIISPYINVLIEKLSEKEFKKLIIIIVLIFSVWSYGVDVFEGILGQKKYGLNSVGMNGSQAGYTIVNFVLVYFIGAFLNKRNIRLRVSTAAITIFGAVSILCLWSLTECKFGWGQTAWNYNSPLIILVAVAILLMFQNFNFRNGVINELARGAFTCFLFHGFFIQKVHIEDFVNKPLIILVVHQLGVALGLYLLAYIVYKVYSLLTGWFVRFITPFFDRINVSLG